MRFEHELASVVRDWLESRGLEVFEEVWADDRRADLVGRGAGLVVVVECKLGFGFEVLAQALRWRDECSETWAAVKTNSGPAWELGRAVCGEFGIGLLAVSEGGVLVSTEPFRRHPKKLAAIWRQRLHADQGERGRAGTNRGGYSTPFSRYCKTLAAYVAEHPGSELGDVERAITHPFSNRRSFMSLMPSKLSVGRGRDPRLRELRLEGTGVHAKLWPMGGAW